MGVTHRHWRASRPIWAKYGSRKSRTRPVRCPHVCVFAYAPPHILGLEPPASRFQDQCSVESHRCLFRSIQWCRCRFSEEVRSLGFTVVVDMRGGCAGSWSAVKPILKVLQEHFPPGAVHQAVIIRPDNFWQKQRTSLGSHKYKFEVSSFRFVFSLDVFF